jgi:hypothetical protein
MLAMGFRLSHETRMQEASPEIQAFAKQVIDALGGTSEVARAIEAPTSTVHSWRTIGIPPSRLAHLRLLASGLGIELPDAPGSKAEAA